VFRSLLVAIDGSRDSDEALAQAIDLAEREHTRLTLMTGIVRPPPTAYWGWGAPIAAKLAESAQATAESILAAARDRVPHDLPVTTLLTAEPIRCALIKQVKRGGHDLIVMGSRGRGALRSAVLGSVSHYVLNHSPVPVLILHAGEGKPTAELRGAPGAGLRSGAAAAAS
jgi:nucleotide-binding universal stress UspA family protein